MKSDGFLYKLEKIDNLLHGAKSILHSAINNPTI